MIAEASGYTYPLFAQVTIWSGSVIFSVLFWVFLRWNSVWLPVLCAGYYGGLGTCTYHLQSDNVFIIIITSRQRVLLVKLCLVHMYLRLPGRGFVTCLNFVESVIPHITI